MHKLSVLLLAVLLPACVMKSTHEAALKKLKTCQGSLGTCNDDFEKVKGEKASLADKLATTEKDLDTSRTQLSDERKQNQEKLDKLQSNLATTRKELDELAKKRAEAEKRLQAFRDLNAKFKKMIDTGKIQVAFRGGRMIVKLPAGILFGSGKAELEREGETALAEVATILKDFQGRNFVVAGHTDNIPLRRGKYDDNWDLSTARAVTVTKFLVKQGMDPRYLSAAGYAEFDPVGDNTNETGRQENRRIEIILMPSIEEMPQLNEEP